MYIVQIASECAPVIKAGGLGDVVYGLSRELEVRGHCVELVLPKYDTMRYDQIWGLHDAYRDLWVPWYGGAIHCSVYCGWVHGRLCFFIEPHSGDNFFNRGCYYGCPDDNMRFAFFSKAALEFLLKSNKRPDIIHCHDWQTGLVPVLLFEIYKYHGMENQRVCYTIHNFKHQGFGGPEILWATGLNREPYYFHYDRLRDNFNPFALNFMKGGIVFSNFVTTVSPTHALEARFGNYNYGLGHTLYLHQHKFRGVLNGIDYDIWNPEIDRFIPFHYTAQTLENKAKNKKALRDQLWLQDVDKPIVAYIGRLDEQKGVHLVHHAIYRSLFKNAQFVLLGSATEPGIGAWFAHEKSYLNNNPDVHIELGF
ncbi:glycogen synthase GlgA, partial [Synechococcus sp. R60.4]